jgi:DNA (cytosine-5)-methyltransferase 1
MIFRLGELFSGPGGIALGAKNSIVNKNRTIFRIEHVWANDFHEDTCETYWRNISPDNPGVIIHGDVRNIDIEHLPAINAFAYGFPCNDFSVVGEHKGFDGEYGPLYYYGVKVLNSHNPFWFIAENVGGITNANEGNSFEKIISDLQKAGDYGYKLVINKYKFEEYGIPQKRHRIIVVGIRNDLEVEYKVPAPFTVNRQDQKTVFQALNEPKIPPNAPNQEFTKHPLQTIARLRAIPAGKNVWWEGLPQHLRLNVKGARLSQIYRRLNPAEPSYTITGSGGGGTHGYHWEEPRALTNRERARIQTFPDDFIFYGGKESVRRQIGMAVPPEGARIVMEAILKSFAGIEYESVPPSLNYIEENYND